ncbi:hypothetical protein C0J52_17837 [Blattella germanica]|nr:hypothetical protein C0J52_17837 [Blattella germanica]
MNEFDMLASEMSFSASCKKLNIDVMNESEHRKQKYLHETHHACSKEETAYSSNCNYERKVETVIKLILRTANSMVYSRHHVLIDFETFFQILGVKAIEKFPHQKHSCEILPRLITDIRQPRSNKYTISIMLTKLIPRSEETAPPHEAVQK